MRYSWFYYLCICLFLFIGVAASVGHHWGVAIVTLVILTLFIGLPDEGL